MNKTTLLLIVLLTPIVIGIILVTVIAVKAQEEGLSEQVKQAPDGTKVIVSGEKIDVDLTKGITRYETGTELPILNGYLTNFTPDRVVTNIIYQITFKNGYTVAFPLNNGDTKVNLPPWQTIQWEHRLTFDDKTRLGNSDPNSYGTQVLYNEVDIYKQHTELVLLNQIRSNTTN
jgi:hypothetical protein